MRFLTEQAFEAEGGRSRHPRLQSRDCLPMACAVITRRLTQRPLEAGRPPVAADRHPGDAGDYPAA